MLSSVTQQQDWCCRQLLRHTWAKMCVTFQLSKGRVSWLTYEWLRQSRRQPQDFARLYMAPQICTRNVCCKVALRATDTRIYIYIHRHIHVCIYTYIYKFIHTNIYIYHSSWKQWSRPFPWSQTCLRIWWVPPFPPSPPAQQTPKKSVFALSGHACRGRIGIGCTLG